MCLFENVSFKIAFRELSLPEIYYNFWEYVEKKCLCVCVYREEHVKAHLSTLCFSSTMNAKTSSISSPYNPHIKNKDQTHKYIRLYKMVQIILVLK